MMTGMETVTVRINVMYLHYAHSPHEFNQKPERTSVLFHSNFFSIFDNSFLLNENKVYYNNA